MAGQTYRRIAGSLPGASADRHVIAREALRVSAADARRVARICAPVVDARGRIRTVGIREAVTGLLATCLERVADQTVRANAGERSLRVLASVIFE